MKSAYVGTPGDKLIGLEVLRFAAAFVILVHHYPFFFAAADTGATFTSVNGPFGALLVPFYNHGWAAVQLFWCISGFIFASKYGGPIAAGEISFRRFASLRLSRLYPLHFLTLMAVAVLQIIYLRNHGEYFIFEINDLRHFVLNLIFASYWGFEDGMSFNGPSWTVSLEILVYALFFCGCRIVGARTWLSVPLAFGIFFISVRAYSSRLGSFNGFQAAGFFYLGVLACHLFEVIVEQRRAARIVLGGLAFVVACVPLTLMCSGQLDSERPNPMIWPAMILLFQLCVPDHDARVNRALAALGDMTYSSYMLHFPLQLAVVLLVELAGVRMVDLVGSKIFFLTYMVIVLGLSRVIFRIYERPVQKALREMLLARPVISREPRTAPKASS